MKYLWPDFNGPSTERSRPLRRNNQLYFANLSKPVGWVERSDTHHSDDEEMGFALLNPSYEEDRSTE
jgi:hypothetical protein